ncbi:FUSC family protein, partial [Casaltella massiliensis]|nr:FUSC family protein [Casaltella massiliensis]
LVSQNAFLGLVLNFSIMMFIGYYFSYELKKPVNMMIGLHYILMMVSPISISQLPLRLSALVTGAFMIMAVQLIAKKNKLSKT